jgi:hypothetical protein
MKLTTPKYEMKGGNMRKSISDFRVVEAFRGSLSFHILETILYIAISY